MFDTLADILVGSVISCESENKEHKFTNSSHCAEKGDNVGLVLAFQTMPGKLKSPSKSIGAEGKVVVISLRQSWSSLIKVGAVDGGR